METIEVEFFGGSAVKWHLTLAIESYLRESMKILVQLQCNRNKKQFVELGLKSLVSIWVTFPLRTILVFYNNAIRSRYDLNNHIRREHQSLLKVKCQNGGMEEVKRGEDSTFKC